MKMITTGRKYVAILALLAMGAITPVLGANFGILGFYQIDNTSKYHQALQTLEQTLMKQNCHLRREGNIADTKGKLDINQPNRFLLLMCDSVLLKSNTTRALLNPLKNVTNHLVLFEGELTLSETMEPAPVGKDRSYIFKMSYYNNLNPDQRDNDFARIDQLKSQRPNHYKSEASIHVSRAIGITTPDEIAIIYYPQPQQGKQFRKDNPDILQKIGDFNEDHLTQFAYSFGTSTR